jgi:hypothetical protein
MVVGAMLMTTSFALGSLMANGQTTNPDVNNIFGVYQIGPDTIGYVEHSWHDGNDYYYKDTGDPYLATYQYRSPPPDDGYEERGYWRFTLPNDFFTNKQVTAVNLIFYTRHAGCLDDRGCPGGESDLMFHTQISRLYVNPLSASAQDIFEGISNGLPYLEGWNHPDSRAVLNHYSDHPIILTIPLGLTAAADINHHEGGWFAIGMRIETILVGLDSYDARLEICSRSDCVPAVPPDGPTPKIALPYIRIEYLEEPSWSQLKYDASHDGGSVSPTPDTKNNPWRDYNCEPMGGPCYHYDYSPVARSILEPNPWNWQDVVYTAVSSLYGTVYLKTYNYQGTPRYAKNSGVTNEFTGGGEPSLAVNDELLVLVVTHMPPSNPGFEIKVFDPRPSSLLADKWGFGVVPGEYAPSAPALYGRYILVGTEGSVYNTFGKLYLLKDRGTSFETIWIFSPPSGDIATSPTVYKDKVIVRATDEVYALPFVEPESSRNGIIEGSEVQTLLTMTQWTGPKYASELASGPTAKGGNVFIGSHDGYVYKIPIGGGTVLSRYVGGSVQSTPSVAWGTVYVSTNFHVTPIHVDIYALSENTFLDVYPPRVYPGYKSGGASPILAGNTPLNYKVFFWMGRAELPENGAWIMAVKPDLSSIYKLQVGDVTDAGMMGCTPAVAKGWVFTVNGGRSAPLSDFWGFIIGWNS